MRRALSTVSTAGALNGLRVLDLTRVLAGPICTQGLGDFGADVIKIERPVLGDDTRGWGPPFVQVEGRQFSTYFISANRNKRSVCVDLKRIGGRDIVRRLALQSDILIENFLPGALRQYGLDYNSLQRENPKLIYGSISGYGDTGPKAAYPGYDVVLSAVGGLLGTTGESSSRSPVKPGVAVTDLCTGLAMQSAILAAVHARHISGKGQRIRTSLLETQVACLVNLASAFLHDGNVPVPLGTAHPSIVPYQGFQTRDERWVIIGAGSDVQFSKLCIALRLYDLPRKFSSNAMRVANREVVVGAISAVIANLSASEVETALKPTGCPCGPVNDLSEVFDDEQVKHLSMVERFSDLNLVRSPVTFSTNATSIRRRPPALGEHTVEVIKNVLGESDDIIRELLDNGDVFKEVELLKPLEN